MKKKPAAVPEKRKPAQQQFPTFVFTLSMVILALILLVALAYRVGLRPESFSRPVDGVEFSTDDLEDEIDAYVAELEDFYKELSEEDVLEEAPDPDSENFLKSAGVGELEDDLDDLAADLAADDELFASEPEF